MNYIAYIILLSTVVSLAETMHLWLKVKNHKADIDTLRGLTGIIPSSDIKHIFGEPDANGHYAVRPKQIHAARTTLCKAIDAPFIDVLCFFLALLGLLYQSLSWVIIPTAIYVALSWILAGLLVVQHMSEIKSE